MWRSLIVGLCLLLLTPVVSEAHYRHRHRSHAFSARIYGFHCASGQFWRPSLGTCQNHPYNDNRPRPAAFLASVSPHPRLTPASVTTNTRVLARSRRIFGHNMLVKYVVQTRVVEKYRLLP